MQRLGDWWGRAKKFRQVSEGAHIAQQPIGIVSCGVRFLTRAVELACQKC